MALLKLGAFATQISGKIGGSVLGTSTNGSYMKSNSYSQNPNTPNQSIQKNKISQTTQLWRTLNNSQKNTWSNATVNYPYTNRVGEEVFYNGYQLFNKLNSNLILIGSNPILDAPIFEPINTVVPGVFGITNLIVNISLTGWLTDYTSVIQVSPVYSKQESLKLSKMRYLQTNTKNPTNVLFSIDTSNLKKEEPIQPGHYFWIRVKTVHSATGNTSIWSNPLYIEFP